MKTPTLKELFENKLHFGHKKEYSDPRAKQYIFGIRDGVYIIDLEKTLLELNKALEFLAKMVKENKTILFVGSKKQAKGVIEKVAKNAKMPYISWRWLGGTLTNFETIQKNIKRLESLEEQTKPENSDKFSKKDLTKMKKELEKMKKFFDGIRALKKLPDCLFVVDAVYEKNAVAEANKLKIPVVAICDTNANPKIIDFPIPANDEANSSVEFIVNLVGEAIK
jgi:small subunit ribosomal protein S2